MPQSTAAEVEETLADYEAARNLLVSKLAPWRTKMRTALWTGYKRWLDERAVIAEARKRANRDHTQPPDRTPKMPDGLLYKKLAEVFRTSPLGATHPSGVTQTYGQLGDMIVKKAGGLPKARDPITGAVSEQCAIDRSSGEPLPDIAVAVLECLLDERALSVIGLQAQEPSEGAAHPVRININVDALRAAVESVVHAFGSGDPGAALIMLALPQLPLIPPHLSSPDNLSAPLREALGATFFAQWGEFDCSIWSQAVENGTAGEDIITAVEHNLSREVILGQLSGAKDAAEEAERQRKATRELARQLVQERLDACWGAVCDHLAGLALDGSDNCAACHRAILAAMRRPIDQGVIAAWLHLVRCPLCGKHLLFRGLLLAALDRTFGGANDVIAEPIAKWFDQWVDTLCREHRRIEIEPGSEEWRQLPSRKGRQAVDESQKLPDVEERLAGERDVQETGEGDDENEAGETEPERGEERYLYISGQHVERWGLLYEVVSSAQERIIHQLRYGKYDFTRKGQKTERFTSISAFSSLIAGQAKENRKDNVSLVAAAISHYGQSRDDIRGEDDERTLDETQVTVVEGGVTRQVHQPDSRVDGPFDPVICETESDDSLEVALRKATEIRQEIENLPPAVQEEIEALQQSRARDKDDKLMAILLRHSPALQGAMAPEGIGDAEWAQ